MGDMSGALQNRISPPVPKYTSMDFSAAKVDDQVGTKTVEQNQTKFQDLISNSMEEVHKRRDAEKAGDLSANTDEEFFEKLAEQTREKREPKKELGKDDFLQLFVAQLQNQDPLNPDDGTEMASKLAQFNGLEQMMNMNSTMGQMVKAQNVGRNLQMVNYVGKEIAIEGGRVKLDGGKATNSEFETRAQTSKTTLIVRDSTGMTVAEKELGPKGVGTHNIEWDGKNSAGNEVSDGLYSYSIYAQSPEGEKIPVSITSKTIISGVDVQSQNGDLFTELGKVGLENIKSVGEPGFNNSRPSEKAKAALEDKAAVQDFIKRKEEKGLDTTITEERLKTADKDAKTEVEATASAASTEAKAEASTKADLSQEKDKSDSEKTAKAATDDSKDKDPKSVDAKTKSPADKDKVADDDKAAKAETTAS